MKTKPILHGRFHSSLAATTLALFAVFALTLAASAQVTTTDIFVKFGGDETLAPGESGDDVFKGADGWNIVSNFQWVVTAETSWTKGGGASVGKPNPQSLELTKRIDSASPKIFSYITTGKAFPTAELVVRGRGQVSKDPADVMLRYEFEGVFFTSIKPSVTAGNTETVETISIVFKTFKMTYRPLDKDGNLGAPMAVSWDIPAGTVEGP